MEGMHKVCVTGTNTQQLYHSSRLPFHTRTCLYSGPSLSPKLVLFILTHTSLFPLARTPSSIEHSRASLPSATMNMQRFALEKGSTKSQMTSSRNNKHHFPTTTSIGWESNFIIQVLNYVHTYVHT